jgi:hypothetical protein
MPAPARKTTSGATKRDTSKRGARTATLPKRSTARVSEVDGAIAVLANDPEFQRRVAEQMAAGNAAQQIGRVIVELIRGFRPTPRGEAIPLVSDDAAQAAFDFLRLVEQHNAPVPSDDEVTEMVRSWSA